MQTIGKMAMKTGVSVDTLRYYEREGLIVPTSKTAAGYRQYGDEAVRRVRFIKHAQQCGFTLAEIRELVTLKTSDCARCGDVRSLAIRTKLRIAHKLEALQVMSEALDELIERCAGGEQGTDDCPILGALEDSLEKVST